MPAWVLAGDTIYSATQWLNAEGAPLPEASQVNRQSLRWVYSTVAMLSALVAAGKVHPTNDVIQGYLDDATDGRLTNYLYRLYGGGPVERAPVLQKALDEALRDIERRLLAAASPNTPP